MRVERGRLIRKGQHSLCDLVNGEESSWCTRRSHGREMGVDGGIRLCHMLPLSVSFSPSAPRLSFLLVFSPFHLSCRVSPSLQTVNSPA